MTSLEFQGHKNHLIFKTNKEFIFRHRITYLPAPEGEWWLKENGLL
jgi:hypothetical protein